MVSDGLKAHGRDAGDAPADKKESPFRGYRSPRRPFGSRGLWERSRDAVCRRASVSARSCDMRAMRAYHTTVPSVLRQQDARGQTRCSGTQTSKHDGATFAADFSAAVFLGYDKLLPPAARARARRRHGRASGGARDAGGHTGAARHQRPQGMANRVQKKGTGEKIF